MSHVFEIERNMDPPCEAETTYEEVLAVIRGRMYEDGLGRDREEILCDSPVALCLSDIDQDPDANPEMWDFIMRHWSDAPARVRTIIERRIEQAVTQRGL